MNHIVTKELMKFAGMVALVFVGIAVVLVRKVVTRMNKRSTQSMIEAAKKDPIIAKNIVDGLDIPYALKENFPALYFDKLRSYLANTKQVGNFTILSTVNYNASEFLIFTELIYGDFDVSYLGKASDVTKKAYFQFVLRHNHEQNTLKVLSNIHTDSTTKFQKEGFIDAIFRGIPV